VKGGEFSRTQKPQEEDQPCSSSMREVNWEKGGETGLCVLGPGDRISRSKLRAGGEKDYL